MSELRTAVRSLLAEPLLDRTSAGALDEVRRRRVELAGFFLDELGYRLDASRPGVARLAKVPGAAHQPRGLRSRGGRRFDARRYALACLVLAAAEAAGERATLAGLFEEVAARAGAIEALGFDAELFGDRRAFVQAVQAVADLGVLELAEGDEEGFARGVSGGDALYRIDRERLALLPTAAQPPSLVAEPHELVHEPYPDTDEGRARRRRHRVMRALVEEPVVYHEDLSTDEAEYLRSQRSRIERILAEHIGLSLEVRAEGFVAVDESGELSDLRWPNYGAAETAALRLLDELVRRRRAGDESPWPLADVEGFVAGLAAEYAGYWRSDAAAPAEAARLAERAVEILCSARLVARRDGGILARPGAARFAAVEAVRPPAREGVEQQARPSSERVELPNATDRAPADRPFAVASTQQSFANLGLEEES